MGLSGSIVKMNRDEKIVFDHLIRLYGNNVVFEPIKNETPDFLVNSTIAVEVRRLNQQYISGKEVEGLENLSFSIWNILEEVLLSFDTTYIGDSYWVHFKYKRPFSSSLKSSKKDLKIALSNFINQEVSVYPCRIKINPEFYIEIDRSSSVEGRVFRLGGSIDRNAGGWVMQTYIENIRHCIQVKSTKIYHNIQKYDEWWLYLVDYLKLGLDLQDIEQIISLVGSTGNFHKVVVLSPNGNDIRIQMANPE